MAVAINLMFLILQTSVTLATKQQKVLVQL